MNLAQNLRRGATMADLRAQIAAIERGGAPRRQVVALGLPDLEAVLPEGGLACGAVHEAMGAAAGGFAAMVAARAAGPVLWCRDIDDRAMLYGPGLEAYGLAPARAIVAHCRGRTDLLWAMEEGLRTQGLAAVIGEPTGTIDLTASRRLQLAAEIGGGLGIVINMQGGFAASALESRWRIDAAPAGDTIRPRWKVVLERSRGGAQNVSWIVERDEETGRFAVVAALADRPAAPADT